jgi:hypothetical protein
VPSGPASSRPRSATGGTTKRCARSCCASTRPRPRCSAQCSRTCPQPQTGLLSLVSGARETNYRDWSCHEPALESNALTCGDALPCGWGHIREHWASTDRRAIGGTRDNQGRRGSRATLAITVRFAHFSATRHPGPEAEFASPGLSRSGLGVGCAIGPVRAARSRVWCAPVPGVGVP